MARTMLIVEVSHVQAQQGSRSNSHQWDFEVRDLKRSRDYY